MGNSQTRDDIRVKKKVEGKKNKVFDRYSIQIIIICCFPRKKKTFGKSRIHAIMYILLQLKRKQESAYTPNRQAIETLGYSTFVLIACRANTRLSRLILMNAFLLITTIIINNNHRSLVNNWSSASYLCIVIVPCLCNMQRR